MPTGGSQDSTLAHATSRRSKLNQTRKLLGLGDRGVPQPQQGPPPVAPAQDVPPPSASIPQDVPDEVSSSNPDDMLGQAQAFLDQEQNRRLQEAVGRDQAVPGLDQKDGRILESKRFLKNFAPWSLSNDGFKSSPSS